MAPSFSPAVAAAVPMISFVLEGNSTSLTEPELAALKAGVLDKVWLSSNAADIDRSEVFVKLSRESPTFTAEVFFKPASGADIAEAHAIAAAIEAGSGTERHFVTPDDGTTKYPIVGASARHSTQPPTSDPTTSPTDAPSQDLSNFERTTQAPSTLKPTVEPASAPTTATPTTSPTDAPSQDPVNFERTTQAPSTRKPTVEPGFLSSPPTQAPTCAPTTSLVAPDYCPCGYHDYGIRYNKGLGRITITTSHEACADRCTQFSGAEYSGGCRGFMTGMYFNMLFCRSYGANARTTPCAPWAKPDHAGMWSGALGSLREQTGQLNIGGNCCTNTTFVDNGQYYSVLG
jgi:hypothetical protein